MADSTNLTLEFHLNLGKRSLNFKKITEFHIPSENTY